MSNTPKFELTEIEGGKILNAEFDYPATPNEIWELLTTREGLEKWFPERAEVMPGVGGSIAYAWGNKDNWSDEITAWEPGKKLVTQTRRDLKTGEYDPDNHFIFEFALSPLQDGCRLRLVQSGFLGKRDWSDEIDSFSHGWMHQFYSLQNYIKFHKGEQRHFRRIEAKLTMTRQECWEKVVSNGGILRLLDGGIEPDKRIEFGKGNAMTIGRVVASTPGRQVMLHLADRNDSFAGFGVWKTGSEVWAVIDFNFYGAPSDQCDMVAGMLRDELASVLGG